MGRPIRVVGMPGPGDAAFRVGLVGYGLAGSVFHAPLIAANDDLVLDTVVTTNSERRARVMAEHPGARTADRAEELWEGSAKLDLIVIASTNQTHVPLATAALSAGLPVVVDKPISATAGEARALAELADKRGLMLSVFQNRRWDGDFLTLRALLDAGELGDVWRCESRFERWRPQRGTGWRESADPAQIGGLLYDLGSHLVDQALVLFGPAKLVYAEVESRRPGPGADDDTFIALEHGNGTRSHLWMSSTAAQPGPRFRALGSKAAFVKYGLDPQEAALRQGKRAADGWGTEPPEAWGWLGAGGRSGEGTGRAVPTVPGDYPAYYRAVVDALRSGGPPPVSARQAAATLDVIAAAAVSAGERRTVELETGP